jgi:hypothetical protein
MASQKESGIKPYRSDVKTSYWDLHRTKTMKSAEDEAIFRHSDNLKPYKSDGDYATMENNWPPDPPGPGPWPPYPPVPPTPDPPKPIPGDPDSEYFRCQGTICYCPGKTMCEGFYCTKPVKGVALDAIDAGREFSFSKSDGGICITAGANESGTVHYTVYMETSRVVKGKAISVAGTYEGSASECSKALCGECACGGESIGYTTQQMACGASQSLTVLNPKTDCNYTWSVSGGGSITAYGVYTAPGTNANCTSNATISLKCEGGTIATLQIAVNCVTDAYEAYIGPGACIPYACTITAGGCGGADPYTHVAECAYYDYSISYRCDGVSLGPNIWAPRCPGGGGSTFVCKEGYDVNYCDDVAIPYCTSQGGYPGCPSSAACWTDTRSAWLKSVGCCPVQLL